MSLGKTESAVAMLCGYATNEAAAIAVAKKMECNLAGFGGVNPRHLMFCTHSDLFRRLRVVPQADAMIMVFVESSYFRVNIRSVKLDASQRILPVVNSSPARSYIAFPRVFSGGSTCRCQARSLSMRRQNRLGGRP